jgi:transcription antitermination protein NusB
MSTQEKSSAAKAGKGGKSRRTSRELALKGIYRKFLNDMPVPQLVRDLRDDPDFERADEEYFEQLLQGVIVHIPELDDRLAQFVDRGIPELSPIEHAILCIAAYELIYDPSIPYRVAINEGVELAKRFGGTDGHKYVNGVLDKLAAEARPAEFSRVSR